MHVRNKTGLDPSGPVNGSGLDLYPDPYQARGTGSSIPADPNRTRTYLPY